MAIVQQATGTFTGTSFTPTLPGASNSANGVVVTVGANTTVTTPGSWTLRTSQVNQMGHYWFDRLGVSLTSIAMTCSAGQGVWWIAEIEAATFVTATSANDATGNTVYATPSHTPTAGTREIVASIGSLLSSGARTVSGWTNSFLEQSDACQATADFPMQGVAVLDNVAANGSTAYSTTTTFSATSSGRSALIGSYATSSGGAPAIPPIIVLAPRRP